MQALHKNQKAYGGKVKEGQTNPYATPGSEVEASRIIQKIENHVERPWTEEITSCG